MAEPINDMRASINSTGMLRALSAGLSFAYLMQQVAPGHSFISSQLPFLWLNRYLFAQRVKARLVEQPWSMTWALPNVAINANDRSQTIEAGLTQHKKAPLKAFCQNKGKSSPSESTIMLGYALQRPATAPFGLTPDWRLAANRQKQVLSAATLHTQSNKRPVSPSQQENQYSATTIQRHTETKIVEPLNSQLSHKATSYNASNTKTQNNTNILINSTAYDSSHYQTKNKPNTSISATLASGYQAAGTNSGNILNRIMIPAVKSHRTSSPAPHLSSDQAYNIKTPADHLRNPKASMHETALPNRIPGKHAAAERGTALKTEYTGDISPENTHASPFITSNIVDRISMLGIIKHSGSSRPASRTSQSFELTQSAQATQKPKPNTANAKGAAPLAFPIRKSTVDILPAIIKSAQQLETLKNTVKTLVQHEVRQVVKKIKQEKELDYKGQPGNKQPSATIAKNLPTEDMARALLTKMQALIKEDRFRMGR